MVNESPHTMEFRICLDLDDDQQVDPRIYPGLCERLRFWISPKGYKSWDYCCETELARPCIPASQTPVHELLDLREELLCASLQHEVFAKINYHINGRICLHVLCMEEIEYISDVFSELHLRCDFIHYFNSSTYGENVYYVTNQFLADHEAYRNSCHAFLLPDGINIESVAEHLLSRVGDSDELIWDMDDIPGTYLSGIVGVEYDGVDAWLEKLPTHAAPNISAVPGGLTKENAASLLLLFQTNDEGFPWTLSKALLDFLSANNLELCMLLLLETTYDGIQASDPDD